MSRSAVEPRGAAICHDERMTQRLLALTVAGVLALSLAACSADASSPSAAPGQSTASPAPSASPSASAPSFPDGVTSIECDVSAQTRPGAIQVLGDGTWRLGGWSHVNGVGAFSTVRLGVGDYRITAENWTADPTCQDGKTLAVVLAKKVYDWDRQHANGMEAVISSDGLTFGDIEDIVLVLRFDPERSHLPTTEELVDTYGDIVDPAAIAALDDGSINLELTLYGTGATADAPFMNAGTIVSIDPAQAASGWVRVQVPRSALTFYTEENYVRTEVGADEWPDLTVAGLRINPETTSGNVLRHTLGDAFDGQAKPETFKEMALHIALIEIGRAS